MTAATLRCDGLAPLKGTAEAGRDYIRFRTSARLSNQQLNELHRARIELDGQSETVLVESTDRPWAPPDIAGDEERLHLTLRRNLLPE